MNNYQNRLTLEKQVFELTLDNCMNDTAYNDNTLFDILNYGFKGFKNMSLEELKREFFILNEGR